LNHEFIREYCLAKPSVSESFPFGDDTLVFKLYDKIFLLLSLNSPSFNVKCDPEKAISYRIRYSDIVPGYHMNKKHWNTVSFSGMLSNDLIVTMIDHSYQMVLQSFPQKIQAAHP
jgi:predicted DNA-binding protein (MmcQ/YjbR family)